MTTDAIGAIAAIAPPELLQQSGAAAPGGAGASGFGDMVAQGIGQVNQQLMASQAQMQHLAVGDVQNLHQALIGMEQARISFTLLMQVRSRVLDAYQEVMKMQV